VTNQAPFVRSLDHEILPWTANEALGESFGPLSQEDNKTAAETNGTESKIQLLFKPSLLRSEEESSGPLTQEDNVTESKIQLLFEPSLLRSEETRSDTQDHTSKGVAASLVDIPRFRLLQLVFEGSADHRALLAQVDADSFKALLHAWRHIIIARDQWARTTDSRVSCVVANYIEEHIESITTEQFFSFTGKYFLPTVDADCAIDLMKLESAVVGDSTDVSCLQRRCISALVSAQDDNDEAIHFLENMSRTKLFRILAQTISSSAEGDGTQHDTRKRETRPHQIRVTGSEIEGMDGIYQQPSGRAMDYRYVKTHGDENRFEIVRNGLLWKIREGETKQGQVRNYFVESEHMSDLLSPLPPAFGWMPEEANRNGASPILSFEHAHA
jgi:hypothetical protein